MPRNRNRTTTKGSWTVEILENAIKKLKLGGTSVYKVSQETGIPYSTLKKRYKLAKDNIDCYNCRPKLGRHPIFNDEQEKMLADHLCKMSNKFYGLTREQFRQTCYVIAERFGIAERFNKANKTAGKDWLYGFLQRHPELSIRKPEATSINRILGFNKVEITCFFENLEQVMTKYSFQPADIYNVDETGVTTVQGTEKIIAPKGQKRVGAVTSWERGKNVTVICAMSASGSFIPPLFIFPRQRHSPQLERDGPPGAVYTCSHNGWTNENIFVLWLKQFIRHAKPTAEKPVLLVMDNHNSHATLEAWELAKTNHIIFLTIPPHSSHRLQPLDVTFFGPLKKAYNKECDLFMKSNNMVKITPYEIAGLFNRAYTKVACLDKGISGFKATGIFPMNPAIFSDEDFVEVNEGEDQSDPQTVPGNSNVIAQSPLHNTQQEPNIELPATIDHLMIPSSLNDVQEHSPEINLVLIPTTSKNAQKELRNSTASPSILNDTQLEMAASISVTTPTTPNNIKEHSPNVSPIAITSTSNDARQEPRAVSPIPVVNLDTQPLTCLTKEPQIQQSEDVGPSPSGSRRSINDFARVLFAISPMPQVPTIFNKNKTTRQKQHSEILTSTPMKLVFEEKQKKRIDKQNKNINISKKTGEKGKKKEAKPGKKQKNIGNCNKENCAKGKCRLDNCTKGKNAKDKGVKRKNTSKRDDRVKRVKKNLFKSDEDTSEGEDIQDICDDESEYSEEGALCAICLDTGKNDELWFRCRSCGSWAHQECSGFDDPAAYVCAFCLDP